MFNNQILAGSSGQGGETQQSLKFNDDESQYLSWTPAVAGNRQTWTWSGWFKRANLSATEMDLFSAGNSSTDRFEVILSSAYPDQLEIYMNTSGTVGDLVTTQVFRDVSAWYHLVIAFDTTQATASNRVKIYVNGSQVTAFNTATYPSLNFNTAVNSTSGQFFSKRNYVDDRYYDGYLADVYMIDGQALDASSFGQFTDGYWKKKDYAGSYGTNGFHLTFQDDVVSEGFNTVTYRGTGATQSISGLGLSPDLVWTKARTITYSNLLVDSVRGVTKELRANGTDAEATNSGVTSFDGDGYTLGSYVDYNSSNHDFVAWAWDAGSGSPVSNTDGSITSTVKANPSYGFSIVSYTSNASGQDTVGHGLNSTPEMIITKSRDGSTFNWSVFHADVCDTTSKYLKLNTTDALSTYSTVWGAALPTSSVFGITSGGGVEASDACIAYCFAEVAGYSSIGSYSGTGAAGNTITTGFEPAFVMIKATSISGEAWWMFDNTRSTTDPRTKHLRANTSGAENTDAAGALDFTSTGFEHQGSEDGLNKSGTTYIYMAFADTREAAFWKDVSGQGNHWTPNNLDYRDSLIDSPANNFAVMSSIHPSSSNFTISDGNLSIAKSGTGTFGLYSQSLMPTTGKWYFEACITGRGSSDRTRVGVANYNSVTGTSTIQSSYSGVEISTAAADKIFIVQNGSTTEDDTFYTPLSDNDVVRFAVDMDNGRLYVGVNGNWWDYNTAETGGDPTSGSGYVTNSTTIFNGSPMTAYSGFSAGTTTSTGQTFNFGQDSTFSGATTAGGNQDDNGIGDFAYAPPSGYLALCTANLTTPTIVDGSEHFNTVLYTGNGTSQSITGVGFGSAPDWVWIKDRSVAGRDHQQIDSVRGATKTLKSSTTLAEQTLNSVTSFDSDGFTVGNESGANASGSALVAWNWKAGGAAVSNTDGSITSQVSANTDAGFSIVSYTGNGTGGSTIGHGLSGVDAVIVKRRDSAAHWQYLDKNLASGNVLLLSSTGAATAYSGFSGGGIDNLAATTFSVENGSLNCDNVNASGGTYIAYCFTNTDGYLKAGSYTGNGSTDGPFVYTGFRPAWIMIKNPNAAESWNMLDAVRNPTNVADKYLNADSSAAEGTYTSWDFTSNGFKIRNVGGSFNPSGSSVIYLAFAETPFKYANAR